jgi:hypothetical protein
MNRALDTFMTKSYMKPKLRLDSFNVDLAKVLSKEIFLITEVDNLLR